MIAYFRLGSRVWYSGLGFSGNTDIKRDEIGYLDYQILQWYRDIPPFLQFHPEDPTQESDKVSRGLRRLRVLIHIRFLHMRILIHRPLLHSATSMQDNQRDAAIAVDLAKESIRTLARLNATSDIYRNQQVCFNHFLVSALAVLLLAVSHDPVTYNRIVRDELFMALDLVKGFSTKSHVSRRLWGMIRGMREVAIKLGIMPRTSNVDHHHHQSSMSAPDPSVAEAHSTAAVAMAGLAGHPMEDLSVYPSNMHNNGSVTGNNGSTPKVGGASFSTLAESPLNGVQMSNELTNLFEAVGGYGQPIDAATAHFMGPDGELNPALGGYEEEFSRIMRDLF